MTRNANPAVGNPAKSTPSDIGGAWPATGVWLCRTSAPPSSELRSADGDDVHAGTFQARAEPVLGGFTHTWHTEIAEDDTGQQVRRLKRMLPGSGSNKAGAISPRRLARSGIQMAETRRQGHLIAALKKDLEDRYGRIQEMHVIFREMQSEPWQDPRGVPWYDPLSGRLATMLGRGQTGLLAD